MSMMEYRTLLPPDHDPVGAPPPVRLVAIAFDRETGSFYCHGSVERVAAWLDDARRRYRARGFDEIADSLALWEARLTPEELARCVRSPAALLALYAARCVVDGAP